MLEHSRTSTGEKEPTDLNAWPMNTCGWPIRALRSKDKTFNCELDTDFDPN